MMTLCARPLGTIRDSVPGLSFVGHQSIPGPVDDDECVGCGSYSYLFFHDI